MPKIKYTTTSKAADEAAKELINILYRHIAGVNSAYQHHTGPGGERAVDPIQHGGAGHAAQTAKA